MFHFTFIYLLVLTFNFILKFNQLLNLSILIFSSIQDGFSNELIIVTLNYLVDYLI